MSNLYTGSDSGKYVETTPTLSMGSQRTWLWIFQKDTFPTSHDLKSDEGEVAVATSIVDMAVTFNER